MLLTEGQTSDDKGAALMLEALPKAKSLLGDCGYDADWFRAAPTARGIAPCIPSKANRKVPIPHDKTLYRQRHWIEIMFGRLKDWRRVHTRHDRCAQPHRRCCASSRLIGQGDLAPYIGYRPKSGQAASGTAISAFERLE